MPQIAFLSWSTFLTVMSLILVKHKVLSYGNIHQEAMKCFLQDGYFFFVIWKHVSVQFKTILYSSVILLYNTTHWLVVSGVVSVSVR